MAVRNAALPVVRAVPTPMLMMPVAAPTGLFRTPDAMPSGAWSKLQPERPIAATTARKGRERRLMNMFLALIRSVFEPFVNSGFPSQPDRSR